MRQQRSRPIDALLTRVVQSILAELLLKPDQERYRSELARRLRLQPSSLQRQLDRLTAVGILSSRTEGNRTYFRANPSCPFLSDLQGLLAKTSGLVDVLRSLLTPLAPRIRFAFVFGSIARAQERPDSDVDLLVVGEVDRADLIPLLRTAEARLGRPVNAKTYAPADFAARLRSGHHFLREVLASDKLFILGSEHDLESTRQAGSRPAARGHQVRAGRTPSPRRSKPR